MWFFMRQSVHVVIDDEKIQFTYSTKSMQAFIPFTDSVTGMHAQLTKSE